MSSPQLRGLPLTPPSNLIKSILAYDLFGISPRSLWKLPSSLPPVD
ncbi:hypothetical protein PROFUN_05271 [Planoprotostelium fungivorum]|uniref:Uncharacterized protein n=1 Tax=Planoprotostelium fungivorum TaxID=1890364 RepID=A0A2P6NR98_9EUKA|nr:hypothetical protein PROFUN_05271 [Planoprotostelium fungivorum]